MKLQEMAMQVTVNYTKADVKPITYGAGEIRDTVLYFAANADKYHADISRFTLMGYSAGAYYASEATRLLQKEDFNMESLARQAEAEICDWISSN